MFCSECGTKCSDTALFCPNCGKAFKKNAPDSTKAESTPSSEKEKKKFNPLFVILPVAGAVLVLVIALVAFIAVSLLSNKPDSTPAEEPAPEIYYEEAAPEYIEVSSYVAYKSDMGWEDARESALLKGGDLVSINSYDEFLEVCDVAEEEGIKVFWIGATRSYYDSWEEISWLDGSDMDFTYWLSGEPTYISEDGEDEYYLMVFKVGDEWYFNDAIGDVATHYSGRMGYIVEYKEYIEIEEAD